MNVPVQVEVHAPSTHVSTPPSIQRILFSSSRHHDKATLHPLTPLDALPLAHYPWSRLDAAAMTPYPVTPYPLYSQSSLDRECQDNNAFHSDITVCATAPETSNFQTHRHLPDRSPYDSSLGQEREALLPSTPPTKPSGDLIGMAEDAKRLAIRARECSAHGERLAPLCEVLPSQSPHLSEPTSSS